MGKKGKELSMSKVELGDRVRDVVSGAEGVVIGATRWLTGCDTLTISPDRKKDETGTPDEFHIDVNRAEILKAGAVKIKTEKPKDRGGPQPHGAPSRSVG